MTLNIEALPDSPDLASYISFSDHCNIIRVEICLLIVKRLELILSVSLHRNPKDVTPEGSTFCKIDGIILSVWRRKYYLD